MRKFICQLCDDHIQFQRDDDEVEVSSEHLQKHYAYTHELEDHEILSYFNEVIV